jgi:hypothetical protein
MIFTFTVSLVNGCGARISLAAQSGRSAQAPLPHYRYPVSSQSALTLVRPDAIFFVGRHKYRARQIWFALP